MYTFAHCMKRLIVFILTLIVIAASTIPCCPADGCGEEATHAANSQAPIEKGTCSPFAVCAGCSGFVHVPKYIDVSGPSTETAVHYEKALAFNITSYSSSLFQPPRC